MSEFEVFDKTSILAGQLPAVTVLKGRMLSLNRAAYEALKRPSAVELLFDRAARVVGLRPVKSSAGHACFVRWSRQSPNGPYLVSAMAFLAHYGIDTTTSRRWPAWIEGDALCICLNNDAESVVGNRARRAG